MKPALFVRPTGAELKRAALLSLFTTLVCLAWPLAALGLLIPVVIALIFIH